MSGSTTCKRNSGARSRARHVKKHARHNTACPRHTETLVDLRTDGHTCSFQSNPHRQGRQRNSLHRQHWRESQTVGTGTRTTGCPAPSAPPATSRAVRRFGWEHTFEVVRGALCYDFTLRTAPATAAKLSATRPSPQPLNPCPTALHIQQIGTQQTCSNSTPAVLAPACCGVRTGTRRAMT
jgi:hypothetical protein